MTGRAGRYAPALLAALALVPTTVFAAEIADRSGRATIVYDESIWEARHDSAGRPELQCTTGACGGETAACGVGLIEDSTEPLSSQANLETYRDALGEQILADARATAGAESDPRIVTPATIDRFGDKTAITLSLVMDLAENPTRVDYFWLPAEPGLLTVSCVVAEPRYEEAHPVFTELVEELRFR